MKSKQSIILKKTNVFWSASALLLAFAAAANAQSLQTYFNLQTYGTVAANSSIVDATGNTHATLNNDSITTLTGSGLTSAGGGNSGNNGLTFASGSLSGFTGSFTIQDWVTQNSTTGVTLFGGNGINQGANTGLPAGQNTYIGDGYTGVSTLIGFTWSSLVGGGGPGNPLGQPYNRYGNVVSGYSMNVGQLYDLVLTYDASTYTFNQYINGALVGSLQEAFSSTSLAGVEVFGSSMFVMGINSMVSPVCQRQSRAWSFDTRKNDIREPCVWSPRTGC